MVSTIDLETAVGGLTKIDLALEAAMRAAEDNNMERTNLALDLIKLALDDCQTQFREVVSRAVGDKTA